MQSHFLMGDREPIPGEGWFPACNLPTILGISRIELNEWTTPMEKSYEAICTEPIEGNAKEDQESVS